MSSLCGRQHDVTDGVTNGLALTNVPTNSDIVPAVALVIGREGVKTSACRLQRQIEQLACAGAVVSKRTGKVCLARRTVIGSK